MGVTSSSAFRAEPSRLGWRPRSSFGPANCCARRGRRDGADPANAHTGGPLLQDHAGDDLEDDLRLWLDEDDPPAGELHKCAQEDAARARNYADQNPSHYEE